jgi:hypothetical protein
VIRNVLDYTKEVMSEKQKPEKSSLLISSEDSNRIELWKQLPQVVVDIVLVYLGDPDMCGYLSMISKTVFQPSETVYRFLCQYIYPKQALKRFCDIRRWGTWKEMLTLRPRIRTNGFYFLKTSFTKCYNNDAFWQEKRYESIEVISFHLPSVFLLVRFFCSYLLGKILSIFQVL